jgi:hypothetical protein
MADDRPTLEDIEQLRASLLMMIGGMELLFHGAMQAVEVGNRLVESSTREHSRRPINWDSTGTS